MKSKQLNFFITPADYKAIDDFFQVHGSIARNNNVETQASEVSLQDVTDETHQFYLTKGEFEDNISIKVTENGLKYYYIVSSYLLEFSIGGFYSYNQNVLNAARFYYIYAYYGDDDTVVYKSETFVKWCDSIMEKFAEKFLKKYAKHKNNLYSQSAIEWIEANNAKLVNGGQEWVAAE